MIVVRFKVKCRPEKTEAALAAFREIVVASRKLDGAIHFDMGRDITDPDSFFAMEVFADRAALERQESLPVVQKTIGLLPELLAGEPEATVFEISSSKPWG
ncbi:MAG TPA: putative quinol monooxygenase [Thermoplasmata archaeon]|nr:putative quinol monooxygenase [Thermoplasmata archaeon]